MFASKTVTEHLLRGAIGIGAFAVAGDEVRLPLQDQITVVVVIGISRSLHESPQPAYVPSRRLEDRFF